MKKALRIIYEAGRIDDWGGNLISDESAKLHDTYCGIINNMTKIIISPHSSEIEKGWAKNKMDSILSSLD